MWKIVPEPARVTSLSLRNCVVRTGSNASSMISVQPVISADISQIGPAMWVKGNTTPERSSGVRASRSDMPSAVAAIV